MSGRVPEHVIQRIARSTDIVRLIGRYTQLKKRGDRYVGLCPFHKEKTPSLSVDPEQGLYYCFGCKEGGNVFTFLKEVEGLEFYEALQQLARETGIDLSEYSTSGPSREIKQDLRGVVELAATFYEKCLQKAGGADTARDYLEKRQINNESIERWRLGYAPDGWEHVLNLGRRRDISPQVLEKAGLVKPRSNAEGHYDRFRNRLMFPVRDRNHAPIGFGARALTEDDQPKYLNSPEGPLFNKRRCFYGFCEARDSIRNNKSAVIVEGYTDVIMAHQYGIDSVVAVLGTALTEYHARTLSNLCDEVILVFDADEAGQKSAERSIEVLLEEDIEPRIASLPDGQDPCDFILSAGADAFEEHLEASEDFLNYRFRRVGERFDLNTVNGRTRACDDLLQIPASVENEAKRDMLVREIANELGVTQQSAFSYLERLWQRRQNYTTNEDDDDSAAPMEHLSAQTALPGELSGFLMLHPEWQENAAEKLNVQVLHDGLDKQLLTKILEHYRESGPLSGGELINQLSDSDLIGHATSRLEKEKEKERAIANSDPQRRFDDLIECVEKQKRRQEKLDLLHVKDDDFDSDSEDERLRHYQQMRLEEDKQASRLNPRKDN